MISRLRFTIALLRAWRTTPLVFVDTDIIMLHDTLMELTRGAGPGPDTSLADLVYQRDHMESGHVICAGQIVYRATDAVLDLLEEVVAATEHQQYANEQDALNAILTKPGNLYAQGQPKYIKQAMLHQLRFTAGYHVWGTQDAPGVGDAATLSRISSVGWFPASIHNNWIVGKAAKVKRFKQYGMWQVADVHKGTCLFDQYYFIPMPVRPRLTIHILANKPVPSLKRLLSSLSVAEYDSRPISVVCHVDMPADASDVLTVGLVRQVAAYFRDTWEWTRGAKTLRMRSQHAGQNTAYYELWDPPAANDEVIIVLQGDEVMSPYWYTWVRQAIDTYYGTDPFMFGISLQRQFFVPGPPGTGPNIPTDARYMDVSGSRVRWKRDNTPLLYQQLGTWGQVFFPAAYRLFLEYTEAHRAHALAVHGGNAVHMDPQIANLETNSRFNHEKNKFTTNGHLRFNDISWEYWFMAMTCEYGLYTLYSDFSNERALVVNLQEAGDHYAHNNGADANLMTADHWNPSEHLNFPDISHQPVYDFWMKPVMSRPQLGLRRMAMHKYWKQHHTNIAPTIPIFNQQTTTTTTTHDQTSLNKHPKYTKHPSIKHH